MEKFLPAVNFFVPDSIIFINSFSTNPGSIVLSITTSELGPNSSPSFLPTDFNAE